MGKKRSYNKRETPKGVICSVCKMGFKGVLEISKHILANKDTHTNEALQRAARNWVALAAVVEEDLNLKKAGGEVNV